jgi:hypothetical protein
VETDLQLGCTVTPAAATGGTYSWDLVSSPEGASYMWTSAGTATPKLKGNTPGCYVVEVEYTKGGATCDDTSGDIWFVGVSEIQIHAGGSWQKVDGDPKEVLLEGTIYEFKAIKDPPGAPAWPTGKPTWSGLASGSGETTQVTFDFHGDDYQLSATCTNTKTVKVDVIRPDFVYSHFISGEGGEAYHIYDKTDSWQRNPPYPNDVNDPACFKMGCTTGVEVEFWHASKTLTFATPVEVRGDVHWLDEYITGEDYGRDATTFAASSQYMVGGTGAPVFSEGTTVAYIDYDHNTDISWRYQVKSPAGTDEWVGTGDSDNLVYYIILGQPQAPMTAPWVEVLELATDWAQDETTEAGVVDTITVSAFSDFNKNYDGGRTHSRGTSMNLTDLLADNWADCRDMSATVHVFSGAIGATAVQVRIIDGPLVTKPIDPVGSPGWDAAAWNFHQVTHYGNVYDACLRLDQSEPRIPRNEPIDTTYRSDLYDTGGWTPGTPFAYTVVY